MSHPMPDANAVEARWQEWVCRLVEDAGGRWYHTHDSRRCPEGFPDLVICMPHARVLMHVELKAGGRRVTDKQREWIDAINAAGGCAEVWRFPGDAAGVRDWLVEVGAGRPAEVCCASIAGDRAPPENPLPVRPDRCPESAWQDAVALGPRAVEAVLREYGDG